MATYWYYRSATSDPLTLPGGTGWIRPEVTHPNTPAADFDKLAAAADYEINFQMVDASYRAILFRDSSYSVNYLVGLRYAHLDQQFRGAFTVLGERTVDTNIQFNGIGARVGLDGEQLVGRGFLVYGQAFGNLLAGRFSADFQQEFNLAGVEATAGIEDNRVVPQVELELGLGRTRAASYGFGRVTTWERGSTSQPHPPGSTQSRQTTLRKSTNHCSSTVCRYAWNTGSKATCVNPFRRNEYVWGPLTNWRFAAAIHFACRSVDATSQATAHVSPQQPVNGCRY